MKKSTMILVGAEAAAALLYGFTSGALPGYKRGSVTYRGQQVNWTRNADATFTAKATVVVFGVPAQVSETAGTKAQAISQADARIDLLLNTAGGIQQGGPVGGVGMPMTPPSGAPSYALGGDNGAPGYALGGGVGEAPPTPMYGLGQQ